MWLPGHTRSSRYLALLALVFVPLAINGCASSKGSRLVAKKWDIKVGPQARDLTDVQTNQPAPDQVISKVAGHNVQWHSAGGSGQHLYLIFHIPTSCQKPFDALVDLGEQDAQGNKLFRLGDGSGDKLDSGFVSDRFNCFCTLSAAECEQVDPTRPPKPGQFKYDQYLASSDGTFLFADGWIIIKP